MLFRLFSDSFVSNVDLYYINNSQVYGGLFLFNKQKKKHFWYQKPINGKSFFHFWALKKCEILFYMYSRGYFMQI